MSAPWMLVFPDAELEAVVLRRVVRPGDLYAGDHGSWNSAQ
jgi:hypothetical protein